jgi:ketosteroid isomerase-like protein
MSRENVEVVKGFMGLFEAGDRQEWREHFDPDVVWDTSASQMPAAGVYHGHEGVERFFRDWLGTWTDYEVATREYIDAGNAVIVVFRQSGTGRGSGVRVERDFFGVYDLRESKVVRFRLYESQEEAREAAGPRE